MASMNFNAITNQQSIQQVNKPLILREGQVFYGSIKQLFPDDVAEVQVGANKLVAKLETPLKAGDSHYFQVSKANGQVELKIVSGPVNQTSPTQQMTQLLDSMNLPKSSEMRQLASHFLQNNLPINKETMLQAEAWLKAMPNAESKAIALQAIARMVDLKMPFTNDVFRALMNGSKITGIADTISNLAQRLSQDPQMNAAKANVQQQLQSIQQPLQQQVGANILASSLTTLLGETSTMAQKMESMVLLKQANVLPQQATLSNLLTNSSQQTTNHSTNTPTIGQMMTQLQTSQATNIGQNVQNLQSYVMKDHTLNAQQKDQLIQMMTKLQDANTNSSTIAQLTKQIAEQYVKFQAQNQLTNPSFVNEQGNMPKDQLLSLLNIDKSQGALQQLVQTATQSASPTVQSVLQQSEQLVQTNMDSKQIEVSIRSVLQSLGLNYEATLNGGKTDQIEQAAHTLKPQLMNLLADSQLNPQIRESAETLLARLNGMQLLSTDNGQQHQVVMQVPLEFLGKQMEATLHWQGRMKEDGKIDAEYARVLFYLQMESLHETVIDMQVQNRIVTVTVFNENTQLQPLANVLKASLSKGLEEKGYQLSGVQLKSFETKSATIKKETTKKDIPQSGVDIRI